MTESPTPPATPTPPTAPPPGDTSGYPGPYNGPAPDQDAKTMALLSHLLNIAIIVPLLIYLLKKDSHPFTADQSKEALNFSLGALIVHVVCGVTAFLCVPALISLALAVVQIVFGIIAGLKAKDGIAYRYPFAIRLIK